MGRNEHREYLRKLVRRDKRLRNSLDEYIAISAATGAKGAQQGGLRGTAPLSGERGASPWITAGPERVMIHAGDPLMRALMFGGEAASPLGLTAQENRFGTNAERAMKDLGSGAGWGMRGMEELMKAYQGLTEEERAR